MFNIGDLFGKIQQIQTDLAEAKKQLKDKVVEAESGAGMVKVTASCDLRIRKIVIDPEIIDKNDPELMQDLVVAAVNLAIARAEELSKEEMAKIAKDKMPNIPGLDLSKLGMS
jgi:DNA-binding YbaB/EbfC family protein